MRLLIVLASPAAGGAETLVRNLCGEFVTRGHSCHIAFLTDAVAVGNPPDYEANLLAELDAKGVAWSILSRNSRSLLRAAWRFQALVRSFRPDLGHVHLIRGLLPLRFAAPRLPIAYTHHSMSENMPPAAFRILGGRADHYIAVGEASRRLLRKHFRRSITVIRNGVPSTFAAAAPRQGPAESAFVLSVGTLGPLKDYGTFVEAARLVADRFDERGEQIRFAIAGGGTGRERLQTAIDRQGLSKRFELLGARDDIPALMRQADLLVNSSISEGLPLTLIEAAMSGLPIVATDVGGNPEVVQDGGNGFLVPPQRPDLLADKIAELLLDRETYAAFSEQAIATARGFTMQECVERHLQLYAAMIR